MKSIKPDDTYDIILHAEDIPQVSILGMINPNHQAIRSVVKKEREMNIRPKGDKKMIKTLLFNGPRSIAGTFFGFTELSAV